MTKLITATSISGRAPMVMFVVLIAGLLLSLGGCANTNNRDNDSRGGSLLILDSLTASAGDLGAGGGAGSTMLYSDVIDDDGSIWSDTGIPELRNEMLNPNGTQSYFMDIQMYRLHVQYTRADGYNREGLDVPYSFDSVMAGTVPVDGSNTIPFVIVRHVAKMEAPLVDLRGLGDEVIIYTNTRCDFWGRDIAGNDHHVFGFIEIEFGDFAG